MNNNIIIVRGGGDIATGSIHRLFSAGFPVIALESERPSAIRRQVSFCEAVYDGRKTVEGVTAIKAENAEEALEMISKGFVPVIPDKKGESIKKIKPRALVDAVIAKKNIGTSIDMAPLVIALGPGFTAGKDAHFVIETMRGHNLGRIIEKGGALPNTGVPGNIAGHTADRVIYSKEKGIFKSEKSIGDGVKKGDVIAHIDASPVYASIDGIIRGMIRDGYAVNEGFKIADIDPRPREYENCFTISDKARCIAGSVLELVCREINNERNV